MIQVIHHTASEEGASVFQCRLIDHNGGSFCLDPLHDTLDRRLAEVVAVALHGKPVNADGDIPLPAFPVAGVALAVAVGTGNFQNTVRNEVLACAVALHDGLDQVLRNVLIVCQKLLGVFR